MNFEIKKRDQIALINPVLNSISDFMPVPGIEYMIRKVDGPASGYTLTSDRSSKEV